MTTKSFPQKVRLMSPTLVSRKKKWGSRVFFLWFYCGFTVVLLWFYCGFTVVFPWFPRGFHVFFTCFFCVFTVITTKNIVLIILSRILPLYFFREKSLKNYLMVSMRRLSRIRVFFLLSTL